MIIKEIKVEVEITNDERMHILDTIFNAIKTVENHLISIVTKSKTVILNEEKCIFALSKDQEIYKLYCLNTDTWYLIGYIYIEGNKIIFKM